MDQYHKQVLQRICRLCSGDLKKVKRQNNFFDVSKAAVVLQLHYSISVGDESEAVFPRCICNKCRNKVDRLKQTAVSKNLTAPNFLPHQDCDCFCVGRGSLLKLPLPSEPVQIEPSEVVISSDHSYSGSGPNACGTGTSNGNTNDVMSPQPRKKCRLQQVSRHHIKQRRLKDLISSVGSFCDDRMEDPVDAMYAVLIQKLLDDGRKKEADKILSVWQNNGEELEMSAQDCLAVRVRTLQSKTRYRQQYSLQRDNTNSASLNPPYQLDAAEATFMPGHCAYKLMKDSVVIAEQSISTNEQYEPKDIMDQFKNFPTDFPVPNLAGVEFSFVSAVAKTLWELESLIEMRLNELGLPLSTQIETIFKDGGDGLGDVSLKTQKADFARTDKIFRYSFCCVSCSAVVGDKKHLLFRETFPNSVDNTRPVILCHCDESDRPSISTLLANVSREREMMQDGTLVLVDPDTGDDVRQHHLHFLYTMVDEKFERTSSGLQGSGSRFICTLCYAATNTCQADVGSFSRCRTYDETVSLYKYRLENPDKLNENDLVERCKGVNSIPLIKSDATDRSVDSTHANINIGRVFKRILVREIAEIYEWAENDGNKKGLQHAEKTLDQHLMKTLGLQSKLVMPGNYARILFLDKNAETVSELIKNPDRKQHFKSILGLFSKLKAVYSSKDPTSSVPEETACYKENALQFAFHLGEHFNYVPWSNYLHKLIEHVDEIVQDPRCLHSVGLLSSEGGECGNKLYRFIRRSLSRQDTAGDCDLRDALVFHWIYTSKCIQNLASSYKAPYSCRKCGQVGQNSRTCDENGDTTTVDQGMDMNSNTSTGDDLEMDIYGDSDLSE